MKSIKKITTISKETKYGYTAEIEFVKEIHEQGGIEYYLFGWEVWKDGHRTKMPNKEYLKTTKDYGNNLFRRYIADGYTITDRCLFESDSNKMDMR